MKNYLNFALKSVIVLLFIALSSCNIKKANTTIKNLLPADFSIRTTHDSVDVDTLHDLPQADSIQHLSYAQMDSLNANKRFVYLTFDDGPYKGSANINRIIQEENAKATVFVVGFNAYTKTLLELINAYKMNPAIEVANHTYSHGNRNKFKSYYRNPTAVLADVNKNDTFFGMNNRFVRLPGRNVWRLGDRQKNDYDQGSKNTADVLSEHDYFLMGWDYEWNKISKRHPLDSPDSIYQGIMQRFEKNLTFKNNHLVILMHDDMFDKDEDAEQLRKLIQLLKNTSNLELKFASEYPITLHKKS